MLVRSRLACLMALLAVVSAGCDSPGGGSALGPGVTKDVPLWFGDGGTSDKGSSVDSARVDTAAMPDAPAIADSAPVPDVPGTPDLGPADLGPPPVDVPAPDAGKPSGELGAGILLSEIDSSYLNLAVAGARFTPPEPPDASGVVVGVCTVAPTTPGAALPKRFGYDAGAITVAATSPPVALTPVAEGAWGTGYQSNLAEDQEDLLPAGGAIVTLKGAGGADLPAFTAVVQAPEEVTLLEPMGGFGYSASASQDLTVSWSTGKGQQVLVTLSPLDGSYQQTSGQGVACVVPGDPGTFQLPKQALVLFLAGAMSQNAALGVTRVRTGTANAGTAKVKATITRSTGGLVEIVP